MVKTHKKTMLKIASAVLCMVMLFTAKAASAATSSPDDLVNTEGFFTIGPGITSGEVELQFGSDVASQILKYDIDNGQFEIGDDTYIDGVLDLGGDTLTLDSDNTGAGADVYITANQGTDNDGLLRYNSTTDEWEISNDGGANYYSVATSNLDGTDSNIFTLDQDDTGGDVTLEFGTALAEYLEWDSANSRFYLSDQLYIDGALELNGDLDLNQNQALEFVFEQGATFPGSPVTGQSFYNTSDNKLYIYDGTSWVASTPGGLDSIFLSPLYPHTTYFADGSSNRGRLSYAYDNANNENKYRWQTTRPTTQDYDIVAKVQLPEHFSSWDTTPIEFKYKTDTANTADNVLDVSVLDTSGSSVTLSGGANLANTSWTTANITYSGTPTWTAGDWMTVQIKLSATNAGGAEAGTLILNYNSSS
jgi:hypothetical protein